MSSQKKDANDLVQKLTRHYIEAQKQRFAAALESANCASPIEEVMMAALIIALELPGPEAPWSGLNPVRYEYCHGSSLDDVNSWEWGESEFLVSAQAPVGRYIADFLVHYKSADHAASVTAAIECDGHDFHERTKQQAAHDKARDRYFQSRNILVLRYTGSEIWRDSIGVATQALTAVLQVAHQRELASLPLIPEDDYPPMIVALNKWRRSGQEIILSGEFRGRKVSFFIGGDGKVRWKPRRRREAFP